MEYNKRQFSKTNNKKVLHKVKKNWVVVSMALLSALGGGVAVTHANAAHADTNAGNQSATDQTAQSSAASSQLKVASNATQQSSGVAQNSTDPKVITQQANHMYKRVLGNAIHQQQSSVAQPQASSSVASDDASAKTNVSLTSQGSNGGQQSANHTNDPLKLTPDANGRIPWNQFVQHHNYLVKHNLGAQTHRQLGDSSTGRITVVWRIPTQNNKIVKEEPQSDTAGTPFNYKQFLRTVPSGYKDAKPDANNPIPKVYQGLETFYIDVTPDTQNNKGYVIVYYLNKDRNNEEENHFQQSDSDGAPFTYSDLSGYLATPPMGYKVDNYVSPSDIEKGVKSKGNLGDIDPSKFPVKFSSDVTPINIEIVPDKKINPAPITIHYINQHGNVVNTASDNQPLRGKLGAKVDATKSCPIPQGYHLAHQNEETQFTIGSDVQTQNIAVAGNSVSDSFTVHRESSDGNQLPDQKVTVNGVIGNSTKFNINPSKYAPSGYQATPSDQTFTGTVRPNGDLNEDAVRYTYSKIPQPQPITVKYFNQNSDDVTPSGYQPITGKLNTSVNVVKKDPLPVGYHMYNPRQNVNHTISGKPQSIRINVVGNPVSDSFTIHRISNDGKTFSDQKIKIKGAKDIVGNQFTVYPSNYVPSGYLMDMGDKPYTGTILPNGLSSNSIQYKYDTKPSTSSTVRVEYINQNGQNVNTPKDDQPVKVGMGSQMGTQDFTNLVPMPAGYQYNSDQTPSYVFNKDNETLPIKVIGNPITDNFTLHRTETTVNSDGKPEGRAQKLNDVLVPVKGRVGDKNVTVKIDPAKYAPQGAKVTSSDQPVTATLNISNGKLTPSSAQFNYNKVDTEMTANILYQDKFTGKIVQTLTDKGVKGSPINYGAYENQLPKGYKYIGLGTNTPDIESNGEKNVILVAQPATGQIVYKDINNNDKSVGDTSVSGYSGQVLTGAQYQSKVPAGYEYVGPADNGATLSNGHSYPVLVVEAGKNNSGSLIKANAQIVYEDADNNNAVIKTTPINGLAGSHIDYSGYQHQVPAGYSYAGMGTYNEDLENNGRNVILVTENGNQHMPSNLPKASANIVYEDIDNNDKVVGTEPISGIVGQSINYSDYENHVPANYTFISMGNYDDNLENGEKNVILVAENGNQHMPSNLPNASANVLYEDVDDNKKVVGTEHVSGVVGHSIDYNSYKSHVPAGYTFVGMGDYNTNLENGENNVIYVAENGKQTKPTGNAEVSAQIIYEDAGTGQPVGSTVSLKGVAGTTINYSNYSVSPYLPSGYHVVGMGSNDTKLENGDNNVIKVAANGSYNSGSNFTPSQSNNYPASSSASSNSNSGLVTTNVVYLDNNNNVISKRSEAGVQGEPINFGNNVPSGYQMMGNVLGTKTYQPNGSAYVYVKATQPMSNSSMQTPSSRNNEPSSNAANASASNSGDSDANSDSDLNDNNSNGSNASQRGANGTNHADNNDNGILNSQNGSANNSSNASNRDALGVNKGINNPGLGSIAGQSNANGETGQNSNSGKLPQTGETTDENAKDIAIALLALSASLGTLGVLIRRRHDE